MLASSSRATGIQCLAQGHFAVRTGEARDQAASPVISERLILSALPALPATAALFNNTVSIKEQTVLYLSRDYS